jgi:peptide/nickel transport system substrate-binding protein
LRKPALALLAVQQAGALARFGVGGRAVCNLVRQTHLPLNHPARRVATSQCRGHRSGGGAAGRVPRPDHLAVRAHPAQEVAAIEAGRADWMADPPPGDQAPIARYDRQVHLNPLPGIAYAAFNVTVPPFNNLRVRQPGRRPEPGGRGAAQPTCQIIPLGLPGYRPYCPFTADPGAAGKWIGPNLARARRLVAASPTQGMRVVVWDQQWQPDRSLGPYFVGVLRSLGYRASLRVASVAAFARNVNDTRRRAQASVGTWVADYPSPSDLFNLSFRCFPFRPADPANTTSGSFLSHPGIDRQMNQAGQLQISNPQAAARVWRESRPRGHLPRAVGPLREPALR